MASSINYQRLYEYRFRDVDQSSRQAVWNEIGEYIYDRLGRPPRILDPSSGRCEFLNAVPEAERWSIDQVDNSAFRHPEIKAITSDVFDAELPPNFFDGIFVSNFLEHLHTQEDIARFLMLMRGSLTSNGRIAILTALITFSHCRTCRWQSISTPQAFRSRMWFQGSCHFPFAAFCRYHRYSLGPT